MKIEIHVHVHNPEHESLLILRKILGGLEKGEFQMAESPEMLAFRTRVDAALTSASDSLNNINADVQRLLANGTLSVEDKAALESVGSRLETMASDLVAASQVVPEP